MGRTRAEIAAMAILYIETHLSERIDLEAVAEAAHYSKYHLHHMFTAETGMTLHDYIRRRRLTRAAELLVFSEKPVLDVSLAAGYESQQAFTSIPARAIPHTRASMVYPTFPPSTIRHTGV